MSFLGAAVMLASLTVPTPVASGAPEGPGPTATALPRWVPGEVLVKLDPGVRAIRVARTFGSRPARVEDKLARRLHLLELPRGESVRAAVTRLNSTPGVELAEPNFYRYTAVPDPRFSDQWGLENIGQLHDVADPPPAESAGTAGADIDAPGAWAIEAGEPTSVIAVLDSGVDVAHPDLAASVWINADEIAANGIDDDNNGYVDDVNGWDTADNDNGLLQAQPVADGSHRHGTHVAGIIAAERDNGDGIAGVCPRCKVMVLKFMESIDTDGNPSDRDETMSGTVAAEIEGLRYAHRNGARFVNASFGVGGLWSQIERDAFASAGRARTFPEGSRPAMLSIAASGNFALDNDMLLSDGSGDTFPDSPFFPASYNLGSVMSVTASTDDDRYGFFTGCDADSGSSRWQCAFANWGHDSVDLAAPGVDILSTIPYLEPTANYDAFTGTSMAAGFVSGAAGLLKSHRPAWGATRIKNVLMNEAARPSSLDRVWSFVFRGSRVGDVTRTDGRLDAAAALAPGVDTSNATPVTDGNIHPATPVVDGSVFGKLRWPADVNDVYKRKLFAGARYRAFLSVPSGANFDLWIWRPDTTEIWQLQPGCYGMGGSCKLDRFSNLSGSNDEFLVFTARSTGNYFFHATSRFSAGSYHLVVRRA